MRGRGDKRIRRCHAVIILVLKRLSGVSLTRLTTLRGEGHHRQSTWGGHAGCLPVVDTLYTSKREGRCLSANIHLIYPHNINLALEKADTNCLFYVSSPNNFNHSFNSSCDISFSSLEAGLVESVLFSKPANFSEVVTLARAARAEFCTS